MLSELPKLFDRNFAVGYVLPAVLFLLAFFELMRLFGIYTFPVSLQPDPLVGTLVLSVLGWALGIALSALNRNIYRFFEGYGGKLNPLHYLLFIQKRRLVDLNTSIESMRKKALKAGEGSDAHVQLARLLKERTKYFPDSETWLLPTTFGNAIRAFEVYPRIMYGFESIEGWGRLLSVVPQDYRELIADAKTETDLWVNLRLLSLALIPLYCALALHTQSIPAPWFLLVFIAQYVVASDRATSAAVVWGEMVKAAFDTHLPDLGKKLGLDLPIGSEKQYKVWTLYSQAMIYGDRDSLTELAQYTGSSPSDEPPARESETENTE